MGDVMLVSRLIGFTASASLLLAFALSGCDSTGDGCDDPCACGPCFPTPPPVEVDGYPAWGPDGRIIAYTHFSGEPFDDRGHEQIWLLDVETLERRFLTAGWAPAWSPDGTRLAYQIGVLSAADIYVVEIETGTITRLTTWGWSFFPSWSPDGEWIAFEAVQPGPGRAIWIMRADGSEKTNISGPDAVGWSNPDWSSTEEIIHLREPPDVFGEEVFVMDSRGGDARRLTFNERMDRHPAWSPDGNRIAWHSTGDGLYNPLNGIWLMDADGSNQHQLVRMGGGGESKPSWSPDGECIVYAGHNTDSHTITLWTVNIDGSDPRPLTRPEDYDGYSPSDSARGAALRTS